jgi:cytochrome c-type biogenesis protein CcmH
VTASAARDNPPAMPTSLLFWAVALSLTAAALVFLLPGLMRQRRLGRAGVAGLLAALIPLAAFGLYLLWGTPQAVDESAGLDDSPTHSVAEYVARLETHLERHPRDARGWVLLARAQAASDRFEASVKAFEQAIAVSPDRVGKDAGVLAEYADALAMSQGGDLRGRPAAVIERALALQPRHPVALDLAGSLAYEEHRYADSVRYWSTLLEQLPAGSQKRRELTLAIERAGQRAESQAKQ